MAKRLIIAIASFWGIGMISIALASDQPGRWLSSPEALVVLPIMALMGLFVGPWMFLVGCHGLLCGYRAAIPPGIGLMALLAYGAYIGLFVGAVRCKSRVARCVCIALDFIGALVAAKGIAYSI